MHGHRNLKLAKAIDKPLVFSGFHANVHELVIQGLKEKDSAGSVRLPAYIFWLLVLQN